MHDMLFGAIGGVLATSLVTNLTLGARISRVELGIESRLARIETHLKHLTKGMDTTCPSTSA